MDTPEIAEKSRLLIAGPIVSCRGVGFQNLEALRKQSKRLLADSGKRIGDFDVYAIGFASVPKVEGSPLLGCNDGLDHLMMVGIEVRDLHDLPHGIVGMELPETRYAVFTHIGSPISMLEDTIKPAYQWLEGSQYQLNGPFDVEHEDKDFLGNGNNPKARSYFWLPIVGR